MVASKSEERALRVVCPLCRAGVGRPCISQSKMYDNDFTRLPATIKHPHRERRVKAAKTIIDGR